MMVGSNLVGQDIGGRDREYFMDLLRSLLFSPFLLVALVALLYIADALHVAANKGASESEAGADSESERFDDAGAFQFDIADTLRDVIGTYGEVPIYRYAEIGGALYEFDYVYCHEAKMIVPSEARCLAPGLVYSQTRPVAAPPE